MSKNRRRQKNKDLSKKIAEERILLLFELAEQNFNEHPDRTHRYVTLARLIGMHYRVRLTREQKRRICKHCYHYLVPGNNCRIRLKGGAALTTCFVCGKMSRCPYYDKPMKESVEPVEQAESDEQVESVEQAE